jgi:hypothetical protein
MENLAAILFEKPLYYCNIKNLVFFVVAIYRAAWCL